MEYLHDYKKDSFNLPVINELAEIDVQKLISDSEKIYKKQMDRIVDDILSNNKIKIVLMAGPSSSGKTTSSNIIMDKLSKKNYESIVVSLDNFFLNREKTPRLPNGDYDFENVNALDLEYLHVFINDLFDKGEADMPIFNFKTGQREKEYEKISVKNNTIVIIEGIHALNPIVFNSHLENMYRIYICVNSNFDADGQTVIPAQNLRLMRRLIRDYYHRGMSIQRTFDIWPNVLAGESVYIKPYKNTADFLINSTHAYEPLMYASMLLPILKKEEQSEMSQQIIEMLEFCSPISTDYLPDGSLLHEFLDID